MVKQGTVDWLRESALHDAHCHLDFMANGEEVAAQAAAADLRIFACTVEPEDYASASARFDNSKNVCVGLGAHPWWITSENVDAQLAAFERHFDAAQLIGEVGLDFSKRCTGSEEAQQRVFARIAELCSRKGGLTLSIHSIQSADAVLDQLERAGTLGTCTCIFHWFSGNSNELARARRAGCLFSVNKMMLATKRGREYARQIPDTQLLFETDWPEGRDIAVSFDDYLAALLAAKE